MHIPPSYLQKCKTVAHVIQGLLIFIAGCITIAVFTKDGDNGGPTKWFFALCFLSIPALIYLVMTSMWSRTVRFANAYAFFAIDVLYAIFWFSAFIGVAVWNSNGISEGEDEAAKKAKDNEDPPTGCDAFGYGEPAKCSLSRATVGFGVVIFILFALSAAISFYALRKFRQTGELIFIDGAAGGPKGSHQPLQSDFINDPQKDVWSADGPGGTHDPEHDAAAAPYGRAGYDDDDDDSHGAGGFHPPARHPTSHYGDSDDENDTAGGIRPPHLNRLNEHGFASPTPPPGPAVDADAHPGRPVEWGANTAYGGAAAANPYGPDDIGYGGSAASRPPAFGIRNSPVPASALSPTDYDDARVGAGGSYGRGSGYGYEGR